MKSTAAVWLVTLVLAAPLARAGGENNREICTKEYAREPVQREVCKALGDRCPGMRDCLREARSRSGGADRDTIGKNVERHARCLRESIEKGCRR